MLSDGLSIMNTDYSSSSFRMSRIVIGERNFMGNNIALPAGAKIGRNVLLGTKVLVPIDGPGAGERGPYWAHRRSRSHARLPGTPQFDHLKTPEELPHRLRGRSCATTHRQHGHLPVLPLGAVFFAVIALLTVAGPHCTTGGAHGGPSPAALLAVTGFQQPCSPAFARAGS